MSYLLKRSRQKLWCAYHDWRVRCQGSVVNIDGVKFRIGEHMCEAVRQGIYAGCYEDPERRMLQTRLTSDDIVMELGSGIGFLASFCAQRVGSERTFTYEANQALEPHIRDTFALNGVSPTLEMCLVGERTGTGTFYVEENFCSSSVIRRSPVASQVRTPVRDVNDELQRVNPTFLILDVEGGEFDLCQHTDFHNVRKLLLEVHERVIGRERVNRLHEALQQAGFGVVDRSGAHQVWYLEREGEVT